MWAVEIYPRPRCSYAWMGQIRSRKVDGPYGTYYTARTTDRRRTSRILARCGMGQHWYREQWGRSADYRADFLRHTAPPYRCAYCGRKLTERTLVVDHIVPVARTKRSLYAQSLLTLRGINNVNDIRNLTACCRGCNDRKGTKLGLWFVRGAGGKGALAAALFWCVLVLVVAAELYVLLL